MGKREALWALCVRDIMQRHVVTVRDSASIRERARLLEREGIGGAPVIDDGGAVTGVVSATDIVRLVAGGPGTPPGPAHEERPDYFVAPEIAAKGYFRVLERRWASVFAGHTVRDIMTPARFAVRPDAMIAETARFLVRAGIHRALVLERGRLRGIVTAMDVLRAVAEADSEDTTAGGTDAHGSAPVSRRRRAMRTRR
ncbi:MAG: CBS domain-containing protein [Gemmatimonadetes bacterium]|nr:CBS domain-containing protein [Gemmatimonadota bacterium]